MPRWTLCILLLCLACPSTKSASGKCDQQKLIELAGALANASESERIATVWPGLEAACGDGLPEPMRSFYQPPVERFPTHVAKPKEFSPEFEPLLLAACPTWTESGAPIVDDAPIQQRSTAAYRACSFERFGVLEEYELGGRSSLMVSWATHQWLLDQGLEPAQAKPITRALMGLEGRVTAVVQPAAGLTWPTARGVALANSFGVSLTDGFVVYVTRDAVGFEGRAVPRVSEALGRSLTEAKQEPAREEWAPLIIAADAATPFATIVDLLHIGKQLGFERFGLVVDAGPDGLAWMPISLASELGPAIEVIAANDHAALSKYSQAVKGEDPQARRVAISAEPTTSVQTLASAIAAVRRSECSHLHDECLLPEVLVPPTTLPVPATGP